jgi:hypothetical protein
VSIHRYSHVLSKLWRLRNARVLLVANGVLLAVGLGEQAFTLTRPCLMSSRLYSEECGNGAFWLTVAFLCSKVAFITVLTVAQTNEKLQYAVSSQVAGLRRMPPPAGPTGWAAASSRDVFQGIVQASATLVRIEEPLPEFPAKSCVSGLRLIIARLPLY